MARCDECGRDENLPYQCRRCGGTFCSEHRLPENHDCPGLDDWNDPGGVFDSGFDDSVAGETGGTDGLVDRLSTRVTRTGGLLGYVRGNVAYSLLALMWIVFALEWVVLVATQQGLLPAGSFTALFVLRSDAVLRVWTWVTSVFAHSPFNFLHIVGNSIVLYFFGPLVERYVGSRRFALLFLVGGVVAGLAQVLTHLLVVSAGMLGASGPTGVLGASGAVFAVLGVLTVLNPDLRIYLFFLIPIPLWLFTIGFALLSVVFFLSPSAATAAGQGNVAHFAHLAGLVLGLVYGQRVKGRQRVPSSLAFGRRGPGGPGGPGGRGPF